jgi:MraZ protein
MTLFTSTFVNKVDKKGRISVPASFRMALANQSFAGVVVFPSFVHQAIEGAGYELLERLAQSVEQFDPFTDEHDAFSTTIFGDSHQLSFDSEGRILLPEPLLAHANITATAAFLGRGGTFQIWEPEALKVYKADAIERARADRTALRRLPPGAGT